MRLSIRPNESIFLALTLSGDVRRCDLKMLYLKDAFHDFGLLPLPPGSSLNYRSLVSLADAFHRNATPFISFPEFEDIASKHLSFTANNSRIYYELFAVLFGTEECLYLNNDAAADLQHLHPRFPSAKIHSHCLVPPTQFILFLFNQLFNDSSMRHGLDKEEAHSFNNNSRNIPRELMDGRNALGLKILDLF